MNNKAEEFRNPSDKEIALIQRLLSEPFPGRDEIAKQLQGARVKQIDEDGSLKFSVVSGPSLNYSGCVPIEAEAKDVDGMTIHFLLHIVKGLVDEFEVYKDDSSRLIKTPSPADLQILKLY